MKAKILPFFLTIALISGVFSFQACKKPGDTIGVVTVTDVNGAVVSGATVKLIGVTTNGDPGGRIDVEETSDASGKATFNFNELYKRGAAGFAVLDVVATKDTLGGKTIIKIEEEKTSEATVKIEDQ